MPQSSPHIGLLLLLLACPASAQESSTLQAGDGATVTAAELESAIDQADTTAVADARLRLVPIGREYNVGISVVRRSQVGGRTPPDAIVHDTITEVYHIISGRGILVTGGTLEDPRTIPADSPVVQRLVGPSAVGTVIRGGVRQQVGPGDIVIVPPHTPHGFAELQTPQVTYMIVRIDPGQVLSTH